MYHVIKRVTISGYRGFVYLYTKNKNKILGIIYTRVYKTINTVKFNEEMSKHPDYTGRVPDTIVFLF